MKRYACATCGEEYTDVESLNCPFDQTRLTPISEELAPGSILADRFVIVEAVSGGAMGRVYKARHKIMKRFVAIKTMLPHLVASGAALKRFQQEAQALSALTHPNILSVYDFFVAEDGQPYLVMDYLEGTNLEQLRTKNGAIGAERAVHIFSQCCDALEAAHQSGIIHRDIKPSNIMVIKVGKDTEFVKVIDFGIAKVEPTDGSQPEMLTATGDVFGTPQYMSPEQCRSKPLDARSDIYSLGCVMYAALTGVPPFTGDDAMQCMWKHVNDPPPAFPSETNCPEQLRDVVRKAMAKEPAERWQSMDEMKDALLACIPHPVNTALVAHNAAVASTKQKRHRVILISSAAAFVLFVAGLNIWISHNQNQQTPRPTGYMERPAQTAAVPAPVTPGPTPPVAAGPPVNAEDPSAEYQAALKEGENAFASGSFQKAQEHFNRAHHIAEGFGESDPRFLEALEWQGKVMFRTGNYVPAEQAMEYVLYALKARGDHHSARYKEAEHQLAAIKAAIRAR